MRIKLEFDYVTFTGYQDQCWKFIIGFIGLDYNEILYKDIGDLNGFDTPYGVMRVSEENE